MPWPDEAARVIAGKLRAQLTGLVETKLEPGGSWLLDGELAAEIHSSDGAVARATSNVFRRVPRPGLPRPPSCKPS